MFKYCSPITKSIQSFTGNSIHIKLPTGSTLQYNNILKQNISFINSQATTYNIPNYKSKYGNSHGHGYFCNCGFCTATTTTSTSTTTNINKDNINTNTTINNKDNDDSNKIDELLQINQDLQQQIETLQIQLEYEHPHSILTDEEIELEDPEIAKLLSNNKQWTINQAKADPKFFERIGAPQK